LGRWTGGRLYALRRSGLKMNAIFDIKPVVAAAGLGFEARIARGPGVKVVYGQSRELYRKYLHAHAKAGVSGLISIGVAGGLSPELRPGDVVVASSVITAGRTSQTCRDWSRSILNAIPDAYHKPVFASDTTITSVLEKKALWNATRAAAVDMESGLTAEIAAQYGLPFAVLRVVLDPAHRAIPPSALAGARDDGETDPWAVVKALARRPGDLPGLLRLAADTRKASEALQRGRQALGPFLGFFALQTAAVALPEKSAPKAPAEPRLATG
jgi:adenosylhomocysteine nucleosidase